MIFGKLVLTASEFDARLKCNHAGRVVAAQAYSEQPGGRRGGVYSPAGARYKMTKPGRLLRTVVILAHAVVGWAYCGTIIGVGRQFLSIHTTLVLHAIGAPVGFALISIFYHRRYAFTSPMQTAAAFLGVVVFLDLFLAAPVFEKNYAMFSSVLGTWIPFALIFGATYLAGQWAAGGRLPPGRDGQSNAES